MRSLLRELGAELRWSFRPPWVWMSGVAANLVLAAAWLVIEPLRTADAASVGAPHRDWAVVVGTYFAVFVLADVTTTNILGADADRLTHAVLPRLGRVLLVKDLVLLLVVGLPTLLATAVLTVVVEPDDRLAVTLPGVAFPILTWLGVAFPVLTWLGVGNLVSVAFPVRTAPLRERWRARQDRRATLRWLAHLALPYGLYGAVTPISRVPRLVLHLVSASPPGVAVRGVTLGVAGLLCWGTGSAAALLIARRADPLTRLAN